jgi:fatty-acid desaturase
MFRSIHLVLIALAGILAGVYFWDAGAGWWLAAGLTYFVFGCLGVTVTFHRYLTHKSFEFRWVWLKKLFILFGTLGGTGGPISWAAVHIAHHRQSDKEGDPHGPHLGWKNLLGQYDQHVDLRKVKRHLKDPYLRFLQKHSLHIILIYYVILFVLGGVLAVAFFGLIPQAINSIMGGVLAVSAHHFGYRNFNTKDESTNVWWLALPTFGEAWHNNHHAKPGSASFQSNWWELDISWVVIRMVGKDFKH